MVAKHTGFKVVSMTIVVNFKEYMAFEHCFSAVQEPYKNPYNALLEILSRCTSCINMRFQINRVSSTETRGAREYSQSPSNFSEV